MGLDVERAREGVGRRGEEGRGAKRRAYSDDFDDENRASLDFCTRSASLSDCRNMTHHQPNPFHDSLRSSQRSSEHTAKNYQLGEENLQPVTSMAWVFPVSAAVASLLYFSISFSLAVTGNPDLSTISSMIAAFTCFPIVIGVFTRVKDTSLLNQTALWTAQLPLLAAEAAHITYNIHIKNITAAGAHVTRFLFISGIIYVVRSLRSKLARFSDKRLSDFLLDGMLKNVVHFVTPVLFVIFKAVNCVNEEDYQTCANNGLSALFISVFLLLAYSSKVIQSMFPKAIREERELTWTKLAGARVTKVGRSKGKKVSLFRTPYHNLTNAFLRFAHCRSRPFKHSAQWSQSAAGSTSSQIWNNRTTNSL